MSASVDETSEQEWNELLPSFSDASVYQTWAYGATNWGEKNLSHLILRQDSQVVGMAQLRILRLPLVSRGIAYLRWGPLYRRSRQAGDRENLVAIMKAIKDEYAVRRRLLVSILPDAFQHDNEGETFREVLLQTGFKRNSAFAPHCTIRLDLAPSLEVIRKQLDQKWRNRLNAAGKNALSIVEGTGDDLYVAFVAAYREMLARKQFEEGISVDGFGEVHHRLPESLKFRIFLCQKEGNTLNALVVTSIGDRAIYLLGATTDAGTKTKGAFLLQWRAIEWLKSCGIRWYDLGGINPERNPGGYTFKSGFGGEEVSRLGDYRLSASAFSSAAVGAGETVRNAFRSFGARLRNLQARLQPDPALS